MEDDLNREEEGKWSAGNRDPRLQPTHKAGEARAHQEVDHSHKQIHLNDPRIPLRDFAGGSDKVSDVQERHQRHVLKQDDGLC